MNEQICDKTKIKLAIKHTNGNIKYNYCLLGELAEKFNVDKKNWIWFFFKINGVTIWWYEGHKYAHPLHNSLPVQNSEVIRKLLTKMYKEFMNAGHQFN